MTTRVLFVCLGNICRSAMAEGLFRNVAGHRGLDVEIDSAGTSNWHIGEAPDGRAQERMRADGIDISALRGRQIGADDFDRFDFVLAMDENNFGKLSALAGEARMERLSMFMDFAPNREGEAVPDPYYGRADGFDRVFQMLTEASHGLADRIQSKG